MRFLFTFFLFTFSLSSISLFSQRAPMKFGKIQSEDLQMTVYKSDTSASAVILGEYGELEFFYLDDDVGYRFKKHVRIKILDRTGFEEGDIAITYYSKNRFEKIYNIKARVFAPDGSSTDLNKNDIFDEQVNDYWSRKRFSCPNLQIGSVIDYKYETESKGIFQLPTWYFQSDIPVRWSEFRTEIPEWYNYTNITQGRPLDINEVDVQARNFLISSTFGGTGNLTSVKVNQTRMVMKDVPAMKEESYVTTMHDYYARIRFQLSSVFYPNGTYTDVTNTWNDLAIGLMESGNFGLQFSKKRNYGDLWQAVESMVPIDGTPTEKAAAIHNFLFSNIEVNNIRSIYTKDKLNDCFKQKSARASEMNLMMIALLREAGVEVNPVLISTRSNGKPTPLYPLVNQFNHVLALVNLGDKLALIDASNPFLPIGYPAINSLNSIGWAIIGGRPQWIDLPAPSSKDIYFFKFALDQEGVLNGNMSMSYSGYSAVNERRYLKKNPSGDHLKKQIMEAFPDAVLDSMSFENVPNINQALKVRASCKIPGTAMMSGDFMYLTPAILSSFNESPFKLESRQYPVDIPHPFNEKIILNLELPEGYIVEELPESVRMVMPGKSGSFDFRFSQNGSSLQMICKLKINRLRFEVEEYAALRNFFSLVEEKLGEQVVLKKG